VLFLCALLMVVSTQTWPATNAGEAPNFALLSTAPMTRVAEWRG